MEHGKAKVPRRFPGKRLSENHGASGAGRKNPESHG